jgi:hypothetical protein
VVKLRGGISTTHAFTDLFPRAPRSLLRASDELPGAPRPSKAPASSLPEERRKRGGREEEGRKGGGREEGEQEEEGKTE